MMHKGIAELFDPQNGSMLGTFSEECAKDGSAKVKVQLTKAIELEAGASLRIYGPRETPVISKTATGSSHETVKEFSGTSSVGCLPEKTQLSFVRDPGGLLNSLLVVLGKGVVRQAQEKDK
jgi:hypothetical protein